MSSVNLVKKNIFPLCVHIPFAPKTHTTIKKVQKSPKKSKKEQKRTKKSKKNKKANNKKSKVLLTQLFIGHLPIW